jgi:hypothetical protein
MCFLDLALALHLIELQQDAIIQITGDNSYTFYFSTLFPHPLLSQAVFTEFIELMASLFIQITEKSVLRSALLPRGDAKGERSSASLSQVQNPQKAKIRSVTLQGAEGGFQR